jgi:flagellar basal body rod protein FlgG
MDGIAWAASAMVAARTRLEIATENLANVSTADFRPLAAHGTMTAAGVQITRERGDATGVDAIAEMIGVLTAERSFESAQKTVAAIDGTRRKAADAARIQ